MNNHERTMRNRCNAARHSAISAGFAFFMAAPAIAALMLTLAATPRDASAQESVGAASSQPARRTDRPGDETKRVSEMSERGAKYLIAAQEKDGGWSLDKGPGITCMVLTALINEPAVGPNHDAVTRGLDALARFQRDDGGIYGAEGLFKNYESSVALSMYAALEKFAATKESAQADRVRRLRRFLTDNQWDEGEGVSIDNPWYGGAGYGNSKRPDLSNTQIMLDALHDSGLPPDDPAYRKALAFVQRCQMLGEYNDQKFAQGSTDGGFIYSPDKGGESKAGEWTVNGRTELRTYGTMTYAGFKSLVYAGLTKDDPRVKAALAWIKRHWTLDVNPNMPDKQSRQGIFYFYHAFARAMAALGEDAVTDDAGKPHDWRAELVEKLGRLQRKDGSWVNADENRWMEGDPSLATAYAMLALQNAR